MARLVHITPRYWPARGGLETVFEKLCEHFAADGHDVEVWTTDALTVRGLTRSGEPRAMAEHETLRGVRIRRFPARRWPGMRMLRTLAHLAPAGRHWHANTLRWTPWVPSLDRACAAETKPVDVVHAAGLPYSSLLLAGERLARRTRARWLVSPFTHVAAPGRAGRLMRRAYLSPFNVALLSGADVVLAQTDAERDELVTSGIDAARVRLLGLGVDRARVVGGDRAGQRTRWGMDAETVVVGHLANKSRDKGTIDLLEAMPAVWSRQPHVRVVLAGTTMPSYTAHLSRHPLDSRVIDCGTLTDAEHRDFMAAIDVFALPSYVESFGLAALEAAAAGAAVIAYAHGGPASIWQDDVDARLVPPGDIGVLGATLAEVCGDAVMRRRLAAAGGALAAGFTWDRVLAQAGQAYGLDQGRVAS